MLGLKKYTYTIYPGILTFIHLPAISISNVCHLTLKINVPGIIPHDDTINVHIESLLIIVSAVTCTSIARVVDEQQAFFSDKFYVHQDSELKCALLNWNDDINANFNC